jgi:hypothetical protein
LSRLFNFKRSRLAVALISIFFLILMGGFATFQGATVIATTAIGGVLSVASMYIYSEGKRPSKNV